MKIIILLLSNKLYYYIDQVLTVKHYTQFEIKNGILLDDNILDQLLEQLVINKRKTSIILLSNNQNKITTTYSCKQIFMGDYLDHKTLYININNDYINVYDKDLKVIENNYSFNELIGVIAGLIKTNRKCIIFGEYINLNKLHQELLKKEVIFYDRNYKIKILKNLYEL